MKSISQETLSKARALQVELDEIESELIPLLRHYNRSKHVNLDSATDINIKDGEVSWLASGYCYGHFEEAFSVSWDYFDDPEAYIKAEKDFEEKQKQRMIEKENKAKLDGERAEYARLKTIYDEGKP